MHTCKCVHVPKSLTHFCSLPQLLLDWWSVGGSVVVCVYVWECVCVCERDFARQCKIIVSLSPLTPKQLSILFLKALKKAKAWLRLLFCHLVVRNVSENVDVHWTHHINHIIHQISTINSLGMELKKCQNSVAVKKKC